MTDLQTEIVAYKSFEASDMALVVSEFNIADALTNPKTKSILMDSIIVRKIEHSIEQWIIKTITQD